jgi:hypothetical protein
MYNCIYKVPLSLSLSLSHPLLSSKFKKEIRCDNFLIVFYFILTLSSASIDFESISSTVRVKLKKLHSWENFPSG